MSNPIPDSAQPGYLALGPRRDFRRRTVTENAVPVSTEACSSSELPFPAAYRKRPMKKSGLASPLPNRNREARELMKTYLQAARVKRRRIFVRRGLTGLLLLLLLAVLGVINLSF
jgi:hypothetical protein